MNILESVDSWGIGNQKGQILKNLFFTKSPQTTSALLCHLCSCLRSCLLRAVMAQLGDLRGEAQAVPPSPAWIQLIRACQTLHSFLSVTEGLMVRLLQRSLVL